MPKEGVTCTYIYELLSILTRDSFDLLAITQDFSTVLVGNQIDYGQLARAGLETTLRADRPFLRGPPGKPGTRDSLDMPPWRADHLVWERHVKGGRHGSDNYRGGAGGRRCGGWRGIGRPGGGRGHRVGKPPRPPRTCHRDGDARAGRGGGVRGGRAGSRRRA